MKVLNENVSKNIMESLNEEDYVNSEVPIKEVDMQPIFDAISKILKYDLKFKVVNTDKKTFIDYSTGELPGTAGILSKWVAPTVDVYLDTTIKGTYKVRSYIIPFPLSMWGDGKKFSILSAKYDNSSREWNIKITEYSRE